MGRPFTYSETDRLAIVEHVLEQLAHGRSLTSICSDEQACSYSHWMRWQLANDELRDSVARAREAGATKLLEEVIEIADDKTEDANSRKVRIYAREKYAAMIAPQRFGQRLDVTSGGEKLPQPTAISHDRIDALLKLAAMRHQGIAQLDAPTMIDVTPSASLDEAMS